MEEEGVVDPKAVGADLGGLDREAMQGELPGDLEEAAGAVGGTDLQNEGGRFFGAVDVDPGGDGGGGLPAERGAAPCRQACCQAMGIGQGGLGLFAQLCPIGRRVAVGYGDGNEVHGKAGVGGHDLGAQDFRPGDGEASCQGGEESWPVRGQDGALPDVVFHGPGQGVEPAGFCLPAFEELGEVLEIHFVETMHRSAGKFVHECRRQIRQGRQVGRIAVQIGQGLGAELGKHEG